VIIISMTRFDTQYFSSVQSAFLLLYSTYNVDYSRINIFLWFDLVCFCFARVLLLNYLWKACILPGSTERIDSPLYYYVHTKLAASIHHVFFCMHCFLEVFIGDEECWCSRFDSFLSGFAAAVWGLQVRFFFFGCSLCVMRWMEWCLPLTESSREAILLEMNTEFDLVHGDVEPFQIHSAALGRFIHGKALDTVTQSLFLERFIR
jgi:hypothetical protein